MRPAVVLLLAAALTLPPVAVGQPASPTPDPPPDGASAPSEPAIVAVYPNPLLEADRGEFVVIAVPPGTDLGSLALTDGETVVTLPDHERSGYLAVATDPVVRELTDQPVVLVEGRLRLSNAGEAVELRADGRRLDAVDYPRAPEGMVYERTGDRWSWRPLGATRFPVRSAPAVDARLFVLPDAPEMPLQPLRTATRRLWLAAYELTAGRVVDALCAARERGVDVRVLVELEPVGGMTVTGAGRLDRLDRCDVAVRAVGGPRGRYAFHHAKYAVADDRAVVLTENWKPAGTGGRSSRGWGVVVDSPIVADALARTFAADAGFRDARPWAEVRGTMTFDRREAPANGTYDPTFTPTAASGVAVDVLVAPDNAEPATIALLDGAESSIRVIQQSVGGVDQPFVRALVRAARRGVSVQLLLGDVWYVREHNRAVAAELEALARAEDLPLEARTASPRGRYGKIHAKGAIVDGDRVLVGSLNWNNASARRNREVVLVLSGEAVGAYYARVFNADWHGGRWRVPAGLLAVAAVLAAAASAFAVRSIEFEPADGDGPEPAGPAEENPWSF